MNTAATVVSLLVGIAVLIGALWRVGRLVGSIQELVTAVRANTSAIGTLTKTIDEHEVRLTRLESPHRRRA